MFYSWKNKAFLYSSSDPHYKQVIRSAHNFVHGCDTFWLSFDIAINLKGHMSRRVLPWSFVVFCLSCSFSRNLKPEETYELQSGIWCEVWYNGFTFCWPAAPKYPYHEFPHCRCILPLHGALLYGDLAIVISPKSLHNFLRYSRWWWWKWSSPSHVPCFYPVQADKIHSKTRTNFDTSVLTLNPDGYEPTIIAIRGDSISIKYQLVTVYLAHHATSTWSLEGTFALE